MKEVDCIIVGGGLAGCCLALALHQKEKNILVYAEEANQSSAVAAGLFNPITGKMLTKTWQADLVFKTLHQFYADAEKLLQQKFFYPKPIYRPFLSIEEQNNWMAQSQEPKLAAFIKKMFLQSTHTQGVKDSFGGILLQQTGFVDTQIFMHACKQYFQQQNKWLNEKFKYDALQLTNDSSIQYHTIKAQHIIFCEGTNSLQNPYFNWVPIKPLKGETLTIQTDFQTDFILNRGVYAVPLKQEQQFKIGATYDHRIESQSITEEAKREIQEKWEAIAELPYQVINQNWGIRPTSPDRKPIIGLHPQHKTMAILNGLGTKGVSLAPLAAVYLSDKMINQNDNSIYDAMNVSRYYSLYWKSL